MVSVEFWFFVITLIKNDDDIVCALNDVYSDSENEGDLLIGDVENYIHGVPSGTEKAQVSLPLDIEEIQEKPPTDTLLLGESRGDSSPASN